MVLDLPRGRCLSREAIQARPNSNRIKFTPDQLQTELIQTWLFSASGSCLNYFGRSLIRLELLGCTPCVQTGSWMGPPQGKRIPRVGRLRRKGLKELAAHLVSGRLHFLEDVLVEGFGCSFQGSGFGDQGSGFRVLQGFGCRFQGSDFWTQGSGFRVQGSGFRA